MPLLTKNLCLNQIKEHSNELLKKLLFQGASDLPEIKVKSLKKIPNMLSRIEEPKV